MLICDSQYNENPPSPHPDCLKILTELTMEQEANTYDERNPFHSSYSSKCNSSPEKFTKEKSTNILQELNNNSPLFNPREKRHRNHKSKSKKENKQKVNIPTYKNLAEGISSLYSVYTPDFGKEFKPVDYGENKGGWNSIANMILSPFAPKTKNELELMEIGKRNMNRRLKNERKNKILKENMEKEKKETKKTQKQFLWNQEKKKFMWRALIHNKKLVFKNNFSLNTKSSQTERKEFSSISVNDDSISETNNSHRTSQMQSQLHCTSKDQKENMINHSISLKENEAAGIKRPGSCDPNNRNKGMRDCSNRKYYNIGSREMKDLANYRSAKTIEQDERKQPYLLKLQERAYKKPLSIRRLNKPQEENSFNFTLNAKEKENPQKENKENVSSYPKECRNSSEQENSKPSRGSRKGCERGYLGKPIELVMNKISLKQKIPSCSSEFCISKTDTHTPTTLSHFNKLSKPPKPNLETQNKNSIPKPQKEKEKKKTERIKIKDLALMNCCSSFHSINGLHSLTATQTKSPLAFSLKKRIRNSICAAEVPNTLQNRSPLASLSPIQQFPTHVQSHPHTRNPNTLLKTNSTNTTTSHSNNNNHSSLSNSQNNQNWINSNIAQLPNLHAGHNGKSGNNSVLRGKNSAGGALYFVNYKCKESAKIQEKEKEKERGKSRSSSRAHKRRKSNSSLRQSFLLNNHSKKRRKSVTKKIQNKSYIIHSHILPYLS
jgi:hypothetical protein